jgi:hypothetical protein
MQPDQPTTPVNEPQAPQPAPSPVQPIPLQQPEAQVYDTTPEMPVDELEDLSQDQPIQWQAPEYVQERRSPWWFIAFWAVAIILMVLAAFVMRSWSFAILVPAMAAALTIYSHRPPHMIGYVLSSKGLYINEKLHPMSEFRSFGILKEEAIPSLMLIPVRRFRPGLTVHFPEETGEAIVDLLGSRIPMQELKFDIFDRVIKTLHI